MSLRKERARQAPAVPCRDVCAAVPAKKRSVLVPAPEALENSVIFSPNRRLKSTARLQHGGEFLFEYTDDMVSRAYMAAKNGVPIHAMCLFKE